MPKNKIGILTLPINNNYGGIIQLAALYNFLESNDIEDLDINPAEMFNMESDKSNEDMDEKDL